MKRKTRVKSTSSTSASGTTERSPLVKTSIEQDSDATKKASTSRMTLTMEEQEERVSLYVSQGDIELHGGLAASTSNDAGDSSSNPIMKSAMDEIDAHDDKLDREEGLVKCVEDFLFPPHLPRSCQLLRPENIAIPMCYLLVGLLQGLSSALINVFPIDLGANEAQQQTLSSIRSLPATFKILFGFVSDNFPLCGYRRKPYMLGGWFVASLAMFALLSFSNVDILSQQGSCFGNNENNENDNNIDNENDNSAIPADAPSVPFLAACLLMFGFGFWFADVMGDSIVAEKAKLEPPECRGSIQSSCYSYRFFGLMVAAPFSTYVYTTIGPFYVVLILALLPLSILPLVYVLNERYNIPIRSTPDQCREIWKTVCSRAVWQPLGFVFLFNVLQVSNAAWKEFSRTVLGFTSCQLNLILIASLVLLYVGIIIYKYFLIDMSWRNVYIFTTLLNGVISALQILLIQGITFGLSPFWFALGDDAFAEFLIGIQFLPTTIMMVHLCPDGSEGAAYAMFTTVNNAGLLVSPAISTLLLGIWDVSKSALQAHELSGLTNLTLLTTALQTSGILFVGWLPRFRQDLVALKQMGGSSQIGGSIVLLVTFGSLAYAIFVGVMNIVHPGWMGET